MKRLLPILVVAACGITGCDTVIDHIGKQTQLTANRAKWINAGITSYEYRYRLSCFCPPDTYREKNIVVRDGAVVSATFIDDGSPVPADQLNGLPTINDLFDDIQQALNDTNSSIDFTVEVEYDAELGYPRSISLQAPPNIADADSVQTAVLATA